VEAFKSLMALRCKFKCAQNLELLLKHITKYQISALKNNAPTNIKRTGIELAEGASVAGAFDVILKKTKSLSLRKGERDRAYNRSYHMFSMSTRLPSPTVDCFVPHNRERDKLYLRNVNQLFG
jgi:hypothetical protein